MRSATDDRTIVSALPPARELRVVNWPVRDDPAYALGVFVLVAACGAAVAAAAGSGSIGLIVLIALLLTTWRLWLPVTCELTPAGLTLRFLRWQRQVRWRQVTDVAVVSRGVVLRCHAATGRPRRVINFFVPWRHHPHLVVDFFAYYRPAPPGERTVDRGQPPGAAPR